MKNNENIKAYVNTDVNPIEIYLFGKFIIYKKASYTYCIEKGIATNVLYRSIRYYFLGILFIEIFNYRFPEYFERYPNE